MLLLIITIRLRITWCKYLGELGQEIQVFRNDQVTLEEIRELTPDHIVISPGPGTPGRWRDFAGCLREFGPTTPIFGVCLGHQCIGQAYGGKVTSAPRLMHGKVSAVYHNSGGIFSGVPSPFNATRYHSLIVEEPIPDELEVTAFTSQGEVMGVRHKNLPHCGRTVPPRKHPDGTRQANITKFFG